MAAEALTPIECASQPLGLSFHPSRNILASALVNGCVELHDYSLQHEQKHDDDDDKEEEDDSDNDHDKPSSSPSSSSKASLLTSIPLHNKEGKSCRSVIFSSGNDKLENNNGGGSHLYTCGSDCSLYGLDVEIAASSSSSSLSRHGITWQIPSAHATGINRMFQLPTNAPTGPLLCTGDNDGMVRLWDVRICNDASDNSSSSMSTTAAADSTIIPKGCIAQWSSTHSDFISDFDCDANGTSLLATSGDCSLSVLDVRKAKHYIKKGKEDNDRYVIGQSADQHDELLSMIVMKNDKKVVCGTQEGMLSIFSWNRWDDASDRFSGHPRSIDALLKIDEDTCLTGSEDGLLRIVQVHPNKLLGVLGEHGGFPVEELGFSGDRKVIGSCSHDSLIRLWDVSFLADADDDSDQEEEEEEEKKDGDETCANDVASAKPKVTGNTGNGSDNEWEDMDDETDSDHDDDSDDSDDSSCNQRGRKKFKTENELFFEDL